MYYEISFRLKYIQQKVDWPLPLQTTKIIKLSVKKKRRKRKKKFEVLSHVWLGQIRSIGILSLGITWGAGVRLDPPHQPVPPRAATAAAPLLHCCPVHSGPNRAEPPPQFLVIWTNEMLLLMMLIVAIIIFQSHCVKTVVTLLEF